VNRLRFSLLLIFLLKSSTGSAKNVENKERTARTACLAGDYAKGVAILSELFVETQDAGFIYNQGRCFEQNHRYDDAISRFQEYLRVTKKIGRSDKAETQKHITECSTLLEREKSAATAAESAGPSGGAAAKDKSASQEAKERAARKACLTGNPASGVAILTDLFLDTKDPTHLFNQGRCFEQNRRYEDAIGRFREYLVKAKNLQPDEKADTDKHIATCESYLHGKTDETPKPVVAQPRAAGTQEPPLVTASPEPSLGQPHSKLRAAGLAAVAVGGAGIITGLLLNLKVNSMSDDLEKEYDPAIESSRKSFKMAGWIAYGAGAACLTGGVILYYLGRNRDEKASRLALLPTLGPDIAGTVLVGAF